MLIISQKQSIFIKYLSIICSILVVYTHAYNLDVYSISNNGTVLEKIMFFLEKFISDGVSRVAVPLFFLISGFFFFYKIKPTFEWFDKKFKKRFESLVIPYIFWNSTGYFIFIIPYFFTPLRNIINGYNTNPDFINFIESVFLHKYNNVFWFVLNLIILVYLSPIIYLLLRKKSIGKIIVSSFLLLWWLGIYIDIYVLQWRAICFFMLGSYLVLHSNFIFNFLNKEKKCKNLYSYNNFLDFNNLY